jgi:signal transduction histidine kinase
MFRGTLRFKFISSLALILALLTWATLLVVRQRVEIRVRQEIVQGLGNSVGAFQRTQELRESMLERSAALLTALPTLKAIMTSQHMETIQDASTTFWKLVSSQLFVLADRSGNLMALHTSAAGFTPAQARESMVRSLARGEWRDWWFGDGRLFEVFLQPVYFGSAEDGTVIGILALGYEIDKSVAADVASAASGQVAFRHERSLVASTVPSNQEAELAARMDGLPPDGRARDIELGRERYIASSVRLSAAGSDAVTLTVLKSYDEATAFLASLNHWVVGVGLAAVLAGSVLVFFVSTTFTRPLGRLVGGVRALEEGDFAFPLEVHGNDEVSVLTKAFTRMRVRLQDTQRQLLEADRLATIGRMASTISHDLRHPLTAVLAYAEFLAESNLTEEQRKDFFQEIRIAVNRMIDEINSMLGFSKQREKIRPVYGRLDEIVTRAIQTVKVLPEHQAIEIDFQSCEECSGWFDPAKLERVLLNLLFNACEAVPPDGGRIAVSCRNSGRGLEIRVEDNGPGIPDTIRDTLFQPFVSAGKEKGIGLGLTVVQKIMQDHGGEVLLESTGPQGTIFRLVFPARVESPVK